MISIQEQTFRRNGVPRSASSPKSFFVTWEQVRPRVKVRDREARSPGRRGDRSPDLNP